MFYLASKRAEMNREGFYLFKQHWNDYWDFETLYLLLYLDDAEQTFELGQVKIGDGSKPYSREDPNTDLPHSFEQLDSQFFSLGQSDDYYEKLQSIGDSERTYALTALRDIAYSDAIYQEVESKPCTSVSLLRFVPPATVKGQFRRLARGGARLTNYSFSYTFAEDRNVSPSRVEFNVLASSNPPSNIHVLIGRNGVGKSTILDAMARSFVLSGEPEVGATYGSFAFSDETGKATFTNVVSVSFSAFDAFTPISVSRDRTKGPLYEYIGLKKINHDRAQLKKLARDEAQSTEGGIKDLPALKAEFSLAAKNCMNGAHLRRWYRALQLLDSDPVFATTGILEAVAKLRKNTDSELQSAIEMEVDKTLRVIFNKLSSGHKIVLLTVTRLVQSVSEKTLVLLDEPEAHLHPPLLSAFTRALSDLLADRNGVAILATHSPVILQEVPRSCAWILSRTGRHSKITKPRMETFGENVGVLTSEVFNLEITATGFHQRLFDAAAKARSYEEALEMFGGQMGAEGRILLETMILQKSEA